MDAERDLGSQQNQLATQNFDLRISNLADFIQSFLEPTAKTLIDIGAGNGLFLKYFMRLGYHVTGRELEKELVANMNRDPALSKIDIKQADITSSVGGENYDVVIASDVIEHIKNDRLALKNLWTFVRPGGQLVITVPAHPHLYGLRDQDWGHFRRYNKALMSERLSPLGGEIEVLAYWNTVGYFAYYFYEKILHRKIDETMRYSPTLKGRMVRGVLSFLLKLEKMTRGTPVGLTLVAIVRK